MPDPFGGLLQRVSRVADTQREALKRLQKLREEQERGVLVRGRPPTVGQFLDQRWKDADRASGRAPTTATGR